MGIFFKEQNNQVAAIAFTRALEYAVISNKKSLMEAASMSFDISDILSWKGDL